MKPRKKRPVPPPPPMAAEDFEKPLAGVEPEPPSMTSSMVDLDDPIYLERHRLAGQLQRKSAEEGFVLLKNHGALPFAGKKLNVFGRHACVFFDPELYRARGIEINTELFAVYRDFKTRDAGYTGSGWDESTNTYTRQNRTSTGMFGMMGNLEHEIFIGHDVYNEDGTIRVQALDPAILERAKAFSDTAVVVIFRNGGEGADHEKGDEELSEGEAAMLSFCTESFRKTIVILATNSVIDGEFLEHDTTWSYYLYTYGGEVYSNNVGREVLADYDSRVELKYVDEQGAPAPHRYSIHADRIAGVFYTCNKPGSYGGAALLDLLIGRQTPSGRLMDEIVCDYDDNPVSKCFGGLTFPRDATGNNRYIYGHNYVAYKEGVYLGYKYFETFRPERVVYPFGYGLSYTAFEWDVGSLKTGTNEYGELQFHLDVTVANTGDRPGKDVVQIYVTPPYDGTGPYHLEKPLVSLCAFEKTKLLQPGDRDTVSLTWNARDIANWSDVLECYVLEAGTYCFAVAAHANAAHTAPAAALLWITGEIRYAFDEVTKTPYRNLFTGSEASGWRFDAKGTKRENIVYLHRIDVDGTPVVAPSTYPETHILNERTRETDQCLDLEKRNLDSYFEMDGTNIHFYGEDIPAPATNAVYRDKDGKQKNFLLQDVYAYIKDPADTRYHNLSALKAETGIEAAAWSDELVWDHFLDQLSVNEMLCRFYHSGFDIPALYEYGIPHTYSADTPGQIGTNNPVPLGRTTEYCDPILACTFNKELCYDLGLALAREAAASGENGTSYFYAPGNNLHRSCLSGKNNNYFSEDAYLAGWICGHFTKGLEEGGVNVCMKHFACNDQEVSREGLVVFANEQTLRENYFAAFEHAIKIGGAKGIMTSLGRVGTVNACGNSHLTVELLRKEWGFDGMVITDGYGVTSYMYDINCMLGSHSGLLCFGQSGNFGECRDYMELYRYYLQYPGRTTAALRDFFKGCCESVMRCHTFRDLYTAFDYSGSEFAGTTTDINWFEAKIGLGYTYTQAECLTYLGVELHDGEYNPPSMMPNDNCKERGGTIRLDDYGLQPAALSAAPGETLRIPVSIEKSAGLSMLGLSIAFDSAVFRFAGLDTAKTILTGYICDAAETEAGAAVCFRTSGSVCPIPCGKLFDLLLTVQASAEPREYPILLAPVIDADNVCCIRDKQGHEVSFALATQQSQTAMTGGWSGVYQDVNVAGWYQNAVQSTDDLADLTLLSGTVTVRA